MKNKIEYNADYSAAILTTAKFSAVVTFDKRASSSRVDDFSSDVIATWGDGNDFPQKVIEDIRKDVELGPLFEKQAALLYSGGLTWGIPEYNDDGKKILRPLPPARNIIVQKWMRDSQVHRYLYEASEDLTRFANAFPEVILRMDRKEIIQLCAQPAEYCRWELQNKDGIVEHCYFNVNFPDVPHTHKSTRKIPVLDPYYKPAEALKQTKKGHNFIYPLSFPAPGCNYYQLANWNGLRESGWLSFSQAIPKFKMNILEKQVNIKYHIEISSMYWETKYKNWSTMKDAERKKIVDAELKSFTDIMSGVANSGNSLVTAMITKPEWNKEYSMWKITPIESKLGKGEFMEEMKEASLAKMQAVGLHPALIGTMPNNGMGGAGSNIREAYNLNAILTKPKQDLLLEPLYLVRDFNGWDPEMEFMIQNPFMTTLDKGKELDNQKPQ